MFTARSGHCHVTYFAIQAGKLRSAQASVGSHSIQYFSSAKHCDISFQLFYRSLSWKAMLEGLQGMHGDFPPHRWHNPTPDLLPGHAWWASMATAHFQRQAHEAKMTQGQSSTIMERMTRKKKSLVFCVLWGKTIPQFTNSYVSSWQSFIISYLYPNIQIKGKAYCISWDWVWTETRQDIQPQRTRRNSFLTYGG